MRCPRLPAALVLLVLPGCNLPIDRKGDAPVAPGDPRYAHAVQVRYLGVAGFLIRRGDDVVLTAPLYSNPNVVAEAFGTIRPKLERIRRFHPGDAPAADAILVGHAHYDHLMDVPYVFQLRPGGHIYGNATTRNILAAYDGQQPTEFPSPVPTLAPSDVVALDDAADPTHYKLDARNCVGTPPSLGSSGHPCDPWPAQDGDWEPVKTGAVRIRALCARHPPQLLGYHQSPGCVNEPQARLPDRASDYLEGRPLVYLIDFLEEGKVAFRVYFQDVPSDGRLGQVPDSLIAERPVDLALLCVGNWREVENQDAATIVRNLRPQNVLLGHWEDFFRDQSKPLLPAPLQDVGEYLRLVRREIGALDCPAKVRLTLPAPQVLTVYEAQPTSCRAR